MVAIGGGALALYGMRLMGLGLLPTDNVGPLVAVVACGICLGFLPFNFNPARIFMGDAGALLPGPAHGGLDHGHRGSGAHAVPISGVTFFFFAPLFIPFFILGVPLVDMAFAFVRRTARGPGFDTPDKEHIHHRLLRLGHGPRRTVIILWAWTALLSGFLLFPLFMHQVNAFIPRCGRPGGRALHLLPPRSPPRQRRRRGRWAGGPPGGEPEAQVAAEVVATADPHAPEQGLSGDPGDAQAVAEGLGFHS